MRAETLPGRLLPRTEPSRQVRYKFSMDVCREVAPCDGPVQLTSPSAAVCVACGGLSEEESMRGLRSRVILALMGVMALGLVAGCSDSSGPPVIQNPMTIRITNNTLGKVLFVFFKGCGETSWGIDRLPNHPVEGVIEVGASKDFTEEAGCWDLRADHKTGPEVADPLATLTLENQIIDKDEVLTWTLTQVQEGGQD